VTVPTRNPLNRRRSRDAGLVTCKTGRLAKLAAAVKAAPGDDKVWRRFAAAARELAEILSRVVADRTLFGLEE
jgi:hypothetical protein